MGITVEGWTWQTTIYLVLSVLVIPNLLGIGLGIMSRTQRVDRVLRRFDLDMFTRTPTAWDAKVFRRKDPCYVIVETSKGEYYGGLDVRGAVGEACRGGDIFIHPQYEVKDDDWHEIPNGQGVWIAGNSIISVRMLEGSEPIEKEGQE